MTTNDIFNVTENERCTPNKDEELLKEETFRMFERVHWRKSETIAVKYPVCDSIEKQKW